MTSGVGSIGVRSLGLTQSARVGSALRDTRLGYRTLAERFYDILDRVVAGTPIDAE